MHKKIYFIFIAFISVRFEQVFGIVQMNGLKFKIIVDRIKQVFIGDCNNP